MFHVEAKLYEVETLAQAGPQPGLERARRFGITGEKNARH
jgi:hypothetical protein